MPNGDCPANIDECPHLERSAELAVKKVFAILGVNIDEPKEVASFQENLRFAATLRQAADRGMFAFAVLLVTGAAAMIWAGILASVGKHL